MVFLAIDSDSVGIEEGADIENLYGLTEANSTEARALRLMSKHWPWPREVYALLLDRLVGAGRARSCFSISPFRLQPRATSPFASRSKNIGSTS